MKYRGLLFDLKALPVGACVTYARPAGTTPHALTAALHHHSIRAYPREYRAHHKGETTFILRIA